MAGDCCEVAEPFTAAAPLHLEQPGCLEPVDRGVDRGVAFLPGTAKTGTRSDRCLSPAWPRRDRSCTWERMNPTSFGCPVEFAVAERLTPDDHAAPGASCHVPASISVPLRLVDAAERSQRPVRVQREKIRASFAMREHDLDAVLAVVDHADDSGRGTRAAPARSR